MHSFPHDSLPIYEVFFDDVRVPVENRIGEEGKGWDYVNHLLGNERSGIARIGLSKERLAQLRHLEADLFASGSLTSRERDRLRRKQIGRASCRERVCQYV